MHQNDGRFWLHFDECHAITHACHLFTMYNMNMLVLYTYVVSLRLYRFVDGSSVPNVDLCYLVHLKDRDIRLPSSLYTPSVHDYLSNISS